MIFISSILDTPESSMIVKSIIETARQNKTAVELLDAHIYGDKTIIVLRYDDNAVLLLFLMACGMRYLNNKNANNE